MGYSSSSTTWQYAFRVTAYSFVLLMLQAHWISRLPFPALRIDLLLPLMFGIAVEWPPLLSLCWAFLWGYIMDTLSGKFWGLHVGSYVVAVCLVNIAAERFEFQNPFYQMACIGLCALGQSLVLGLFLLFEPAGAVPAASTWNSLFLRTLLMMLLSPLIIQPLWMGKKVGRREGV